MPPVMSSSPSPPSTRPSASPSRRRSSSSSPPSRTLTISRADGAGHLVVAVLRPDLQPLHGRRREGLRRAVDGHVDRAGGDVGGDGDDVVAVGALDDQLAAVDARRARAGRGVGRDADDGQVLVGRGGAGVAGEHDRAVLAVPLEGKAGDGLEAVEARLHLVDQGAAGRERRVGRAVGEVAGEQERVVVQVAGRLAAVGDLAGEQDAVVLVDGDLAGELRARPAEGRQGEPVAAAEARVERAAAVEARDEDLLAGVAERGERVAGGDELAVVGAGDVLDDARQAEVERDDAVVVAEVVVELAGALEPRDGEAALGRLAGGLLGAEPADKDAAVAVEHDAGRAAVADADRERDDAVPRPVQPAEGRVGPAERVEPRDHEPRAGRRARRPPAPARRR